MDVNIFAAVMLAAVLHSAWNGMVKKHKDKVISVSAIVFGHIPMAFIVMLFVPLPTLESVPYIILSAIIPPRLSSLFNICLQIWRFN